MELLTVQDVHKIAIYQQSINSLSAEDLVGKYHDALYRLKVDLYQICRKICTNFPVRTVESNEDVEFCKELTKKAYSKIQGAVYGYINLAKKPKDKDIDKYVEEHLMCIINECATELLESELPSQKEMREKKLREERKKQQKETEARLNKQREERKKREEAKAAQAELEVKKAC